MTVSELRACARSLTGQPGFASIVICSLALGIGANVALFTVVNGVLLEPLPFAEPEELMMVWERNRPRERPRNVVAPANFLDWRRQNRVFSDIAAFFPDRVTLTGRDAPPTRVSGALVTDGFFSILGVEPMMGRTFTEEEFTAERRVVVLGHSLWQARFGSDPAIVGKSIRLDDREHTVTGVMPRSFRLELRATETTFTVESELWLPFPITEEWRMRPGRSLLTIARARPGIDREQAQADMEVIARRLEQEYPDFNSGWGVNVVTLAEQTVGEVRPTLLVLFGAVVVLFLIACVNIANLLLSRGLARRREMAIRTALGAGGSRIARQLMAESLLLSLFASLLGLGLATAAVTMLKRFGPIEIPRLQTVTVDPVVVAFAIALALLTTLAFGIVPAVQARRTDVQGALAGEAASTSSAGSSGFVRSALVAAEVAMALTLLMASGLLIRTLVHLHEIDPGFDRGGVLTMMVSLPNARYENEQATLGFFEELLNRVREIPGVEHAGAISSLPLTGPHAATSVYAGDRPEPRKGEAPVADIRIVNGNYFGAMGIPLLAGRPFDSRDNADVPRRAIISRSTAKTLWPNEPLSRLLGRTVRISWGDYVSADVVGVVGDVRHFGLDVGPRPMIYWPHRQNPWTGMTVVVRGQRDPSRLATAVTSEVRALDPALATYNVRALDDVVGASLSTRRFSMLLLSLFALVALSVASLGAYGVVSFFAGQRRWEMGLRMALGASPASVAGLILKRGMTMTLIGIAIGAVAAQAATPFLSSLLFRVRPFDLPTLVAAGSLLAVVGLAACYFPARRVSRIDPASSLRAS